MPLSALAKYLVFTLVLALSLSVLAVALCSERLRAMQNRTSRHTYFSGEQQRALSPSNSHFQVYYTGRALGLRFRRSKSGRSAIVDQVFRRDVMGTSMVRPGLFVRSVNGKDVRMVPYRTLLRQLRRAARPVIIGFQDNDPAQTRPPLPRPTGEPCVPPPPVSYGQRLAVEDARRLQGQ